MIRLLQFSDIHFLYCDATEDEYAQMRQRFKEDLTHLKDRVGVIPYVLICGDIANKGQKLEFDKARKITYNNIPLSLDSYLFLYAISYNWYRDMDAISLLKKAFMPIYQSVVKNQITISQWRMIDSFMETLKVWQDWDRGKKMRKSVGKRLKEAGCSKTFVETFTQDNTVNKEILKYWKKF